MQLWEEFALPSQYVHVLLLQVTSANELSFNHQRIQAKTLTKTTNLSTIPNGADAPAGAAELLPDLIIDYIGEHGEQRRDVVDLVLTAAAFGVMLSSTSMRTLYAAARRAGYAVNDSVRAKLRKYRHSQWQADEKFVPLGFETRGHASQAIPHLRRWAAAAADKTGQRKSTIMARWMGRIQCVLLKQNYRLVQHHLNRVGIDEALQG